MLFCQAPPTVVTVSPIGTPAEALGRATALERSKDWAGLADHIEALPPDARGALLDTWLRALKHAGRFERLLQVSETALPQLEPAGTPKLSIARLYRALALSKLGRHAEASAAQEENGTLGDPAGLSNACAEAQAGKDWPRLVDLATALQARPAFKAQAQLWQGEALFHQARLAEAEGPFEQGLQAEPAHPAAWAMLGACRAARQAYPEALEALDRAIALDPARPDPHFNRALVRFGLKQYRAGREDLLKAQKLNPEDPEFRARVQENLRWVDAHLKGQSKPAVREPSNWRP